MENTDARLADLNERLKRFLDRQVEALEAVPAPKTPIEVERGVKAALAIKKLADALYPVSKTSDAPKAGKTKKAENDMQNKPQPDPIEAAATLDATRYKLERKLTRFFDSQRTTAMDSAPRPEDARPPHGKLDVLDSGRPAPSIRSLA